MAGILGANTAVIDGQRTTLPPMAAYVPPSYGLQTSGVPNVSPIVPPFAGGTAGGSFSSSGAVGSNSVNGYGTADNNALVASVAGGNPFSAKVSPVWWALGALVGGVLLLQAVSWHETIEEHAKVGPAGERASESV